MKKILLSFCTLFLVCNIQAQEPNQYFLSPYVEHYANVIPKTPNASNFQVYGNTSVDFSSGVPNITIPIYTLVEDGVKIPISISYDASGVKVDDLASVVGLKWRLNAGGGIFRSIHGGVADENGWITTNNSFLDYSWYQDHPIGLKHTQDLLRSTDTDHDPDKFNYSFPGGSGAFIFRPKTGANALSILKERVDQITILPSSDFSVFQAKDFQGNVFDFGSIKELNENTSTNASLTNCVQGVSYSWGNTLAFKTTGWMLDKITTKNNKTVNYSYSEYNLTYQINTISQRLSKGVLSCRLTTDCAVHIYTKESTGVIYRPKNQLISNIESDNVKVSFVYSNNQNASDWKKQLDKIVIEDKIKNQQKAFHFVYGTFNGDPRLQLKEVYEVAFHINGQSAPKKPSYKFSYNETNFLPTKGSKSKDYWGYYNGQNGNKTLIPSNDLSLLHLNAGFANQLADRNVNTSFVKLGVIEKIQYPTGGTTEFVFESNQTSGSNSKKQGGLRVKEIKDLDGEGNTFNHTFYTYDDFHGLEWDVSLTNRWFPGALTFSSDFILTDPNLNKSGHYYGKVTVLQKKPTNDFLKSEYLFEGRPSLTSFSSVPKETLLFRRNDTIQRKQYFYNNDKLQDAIYWKQLGDRDFCYNYHTGPGASNRQEIGYNEPIGSYFNSYKHLLTTDITTNYNKDIITQSGVFEVAVLKPQTTVKYYEYNSDLLVTKEKTDGRFNGGDPMQANHPTYSENYDANGDNFWVDTTYPSDYPNETSLQNLVTTKNLKGLPISKIVTNKGQQIQGQFFTYHANGNIKESYKYNKGQGSNNSSASYVPNNYDLFANYTNLNGKPTQIQREDGTYISYVWDSSKTYVMAKIENATYAQAISKFSGSIDVSLSDATIQDKLNAIRNGLPSAQVTTFMYNPLIGIKSVTDPRGETINYHYDSFGRLEFVKDAQGKIVSKTEYHYKN